MKIKFKEQRFQLDAVKAVVDCFKGQTNESSNFTLDRGRTKGNISGQEDFLIEKGFRNKTIDITDDDILENIKKVQLKNGIAQSKKLEGKYNLTIEMETGERVIIVTGCINALRSRVSGTLVNMIHALLRVIKYNYCKQCMRSKDVLALQY